MKTQKEPIPEQLKNLAESCLGDLSDVVFFDIETTGLSNKTAFVYLIGAAFLEGGSFVLHQYLAEDLSAEEAILKAFSECTKGKKKLIHFNGSTFDLPFLQARYKKYGLDCSASSMEQTDLYRRISPLKNVLKLPNCKLKTLEEFLGNHRKDPFTGGELIELYHVYRRERDERLLKVLLLHNAEDILGMLSILSMLAYPALSEAQALPQEAEISPCTDYAGKAQKELLLPVHFVLSLPQPLALNADGIFFSGSGLTGLLKVPVFCGELKYFYPDYKNYSYLPDEDCAIHKSVAIYVDKAHRVPARPETCYTRKTGEFLPLFLPGSSREHAPEEALFAPLFFRQTPGIQSPGRQPSGGQASSGQRSSRQTASHSAFREGFFEAGDAFLKNPSLLSAYAVHLLAHLLKS
ncbi:MAG TPA: ribonuclease H-like domain-containing protein [Candidatus Eisenbergiella stercoravium]|nr:ribonuclease H-like domain-containing protein [Candidatus Eisenbergiella stercoravium]